jgi:hypothetical protein
MGTMNDINIWDRSKLHKSLHDGSFEKNDFSFEVGGETFNKLWFLTNGIYPEIVYCCFVLHNMAVEDHIIAANNIPESAAFYEIVNEEEAVALAEQPAGEIAAMEFVQGKDDALAYRQLEIQHLAGMGIDIFDPTLRAKEIDQNLLVLNSRLAHQQWKGLYNLNEHRKLQRANHC